MRDAGFWNRAAARYERSKVADVSAYERKLDETRVLLTPETEILELACGTGTTALRHAPHAGHVLGLDYSDAMIGIARRKAAEAGAGNVAFEVADVGAYDRPPASIDMVMAHSVLQLVPDPEGIVRRAFGWLRPGGAFVSSTTCLGGAAALPIRLLLPALRLIGKAPHVTVFTERDLLGWIEAAGFAIDHHWRPAGPIKATFVVARRPGSGARIATPTGRSASPG